MRITFECIPTMHPNEIEMTIYPQDSVHKIEFAERRQVPINDFEKDDIRSYVIDMLFDRMKRHLDKPSTVAEMTDFTKRIKLQ